VQTADLSEVRPTEGAELVLVDAPNKPQRAVIVEVQVQRDDDKLFVERSTLHRARW
jgi:hypothetical protein